MNSAHRTRTYNYLMYFASSLALGLTLVACGKGFKTVTPAKQSSAQVQTTTGNGGTAVDANGNTIISGGTSTGAGNSTLTGSFTIPAFNLDVANGSSLVNIMSTLDQQAATALNSSEFMGAPYYGAQVGFTLANLTGDNMASGSGSQIQFYGVISAQSKVEVKLESSEARVFVNTTQAEPQLYAIWTFSETGTALNLSVIGNIKKGTSDKDLVLVGSLYGDFNTDSDAAPIGSFAIPLCNVTKDLSFLKAVYPNASCQ